MTFSIANAFSMNVDPPTLITSAEKGQSVSGYINVDNRGDQEIKVNAYVEDWIFLPDRSKSFREPGSLKNSCSQWISLYPEKFALLPGQTKQVKYTITVPKNAKGGYYSVVFFEAQHDDPELLKKANVILTGRIGTIIYFETKGDSEKKLALSNFEVSKPVAGKPVYFRVKAKNEGNTFAPISGSIIIVDDLSNLLAKIDIDKQFILQGENITLEKKWISDLPKGEYDVILTLDYGAENPASLKKRILVK